MNKLTEFDLGDAGLRYVVECCRAGNSLSRLLANEVDIEKGQVFTFIPCDVAPKKISDFQYGGVTKANGPTEYLVGMIHDFLACGRDRVIVLEDLDLLPEN